MSARHIDLLRDLSARKRDKEEQQKREEQRAQKRASSLRERILSKPSHDALEEEKLPSNPPDENASAEEKRLWKLKCNMGIERRQQEAIQRMQDLQSARKVKEEREKLKREWRAHKAKSYLVESCKNDTVKEFLESKEKPRALPKIPPAGTASASRAASLRRRDSAGAEATEEDPGSQTPRTSASSRPSSSPNLEQAEVEDNLVAKDEAKDETKDEVQEEAKDDAKEEAKDEAEKSEAKTEKLKPAGTQERKSLNSNMQNGYISKFVSRMKNAKMAMHAARDMAEWKKRMGCPPDKQVFICCGGYMDFTQAMLKRGWFQNEDKDSRFFDIKWAPAASIDHESLVPEQVVNHFAGNREITTKVGLTLNLRNCLSMCGADPDYFYPRAYDLYDPQERAEFVLNFKFTKAQAVLRELLRNVESGAEVTFSTDVVSVASKMCMRLVTDVDDVIDCDDVVAEALGNVSKAEWKLLEQVCLDDPSQRLEGALKIADLDGFINKKHVLTEAQKEREAKEKQRQKEKEKLQNPVKEEKKKKKKKKKATEEEEVELSAPMSAWQGARAQFLIRQARTILEEMDESRQFGINGCRNAWIVKPSGKSRGRGIKVMRELDEIFRNCESDGFQWICQKYIERPQLVHGYKFDIRQWVLVTDWNPLTVYIWAQPYLRFAGQKYDETLSDRSEYIHLVNNSIIKYMDGFNKVNEDLQATGFMWFRQQYEEYLHGKYCKCCKHRTPFLKPPPYTCETFGVRWEDVAFTAKEEDDDDEDDKEGPSPAETQKSISPSASSQKSTAPGASPRSSSDDEEATSKTTPEAADVPSSTEASAPASAPENPGAENGKFPGLQGETVADDDESVDVCENLWDTCIRPEMEKIIIQSLTSVVDGIQHRKGSVELFGYDFMVGEGTSGKPEAWLIEVNSSPACDYSTPVTTPLVKKVMEDNAKVMVDLKADPEASTGEWELIKHDYKPVPQRTGFAQGSQLEVLGKKMKLPKGAKKKKKTKESKTAIDQKEESPAESADEGSGEEEDDEKDDDDEDD